MPFETLLIDKHLGNSHPTLEYGERVNTGNEPVYGVLPVSPETLKQGLHPLTQPGVHVPYFYDFQSAADHALSLSEKAGGTVGGMQVGVTFLARSEQSIGKYTPEHLTMVGSGSVKPTEVAQVYLTIKNPDTHETHTFDTTGLSAQGYASVVQALESFSQHEILPSVVQGVIEHEQLHDAYATMNAMEKAHQHQQETRDIMAQLNGNIQDVSIERVSFDLKAAHQHFQGMMEKFVASIRGTPENPTEPFDAQAHRANVGNMIAEFWKKLNPSDRLSSKYNDFHDKVMQVARNADAGDALVAGATWLRSQSTYLDRIAINKALEAPGVKAAVETARTTQEPRFDKLPMATLGDIVHRHEESPNPGTQAPEAPEEPGMDEIEEEIE